jgi:hypothetical protein
VQCFRRPWWEWPGERRMRASVVCRTVYWIARQHEKAIASRRQCGCFRAPFLGWKNKGRYEQHKILH